MDGWCSIIQSYYRGEAILWKITRNQIIVLRVIQNHEIMSFCFQSTFPIGYYTESQYGMLKEHSHNIS